MIFPETLKEIGKQIFWECWHIKTVWLDENCTVNPRRNMKKHILILDRQKRLGDQSLWDLRRLRDVVISDGVKRI